MDKKTKVRDESNYEAQYPVTGTGARPASAGRQPADTGDTKIHFHDEVCTYGRDECLNSLLLGERLDEDR